MVARKQQIQRKNFYRLINQSILLRHNAENTIPDLQRFISLPVRSV